MNVLSISRSGPAPRFMRWLALFLILAGSQLYAQIIPIDGTITENTTLIQGATYHVTGNLFVQSGITLTVPEGTVIKSSPGFSILVDGHLDALGSEALPVFLTEVRDSSAGEVIEPGDPAAGAWWGLSIRNGGSADLSHVVIRYAVTCLSNTQAGELTVVDSHFADCSGDGVQLSSVSDANVLENLLIERAGSNAVSISNASGLVNLVRSHLLYAGAQGVDVSNSGLTEFPRDDESEIVIAENRIRGGAQNGLRIVNSRASIHRNRLSDSQGAGIWLSGEASSPDIFGNWISSNAGGGIDAANQANPLIGGTKTNGNDIAGNSPFGLRNQTEGLTILARCNWWGHPSGPNQEPENPAGQGDLILGPGSVDASPYLLESAIDGVFRDRFEAVATGREDEC